VESCGMVLKREKNQKNAEKRLFYCISSFFITTLYGRLMFSRGKKLSKEGFN
jgi:hypothetical protein